MTYEELARKHEAELKKMREHLDQRYAEEGERRKKRLAVEVAKIIKQPKVFVPPPDAAPEPAGMAWCGKRKGE